MSRWITISFISALLMIVPRAGSAEPPSGAKKFALVIGESIYTSDVRQNLTGAKDAEDLAQALRELQFTLVGGNSDSGALVDAKAKDIGDAITTFVSAIREADVVLFYYSGHGFQLDGENYLLPVGNEEIHRSNLAEQAFSLTHILDVVGAADTLTKRATKIVILDACRNANFLLDGNAVTSGHAEIQSATPPLTLVAFAAQAGQVAQDDPVAGHSPFTQALLVNIREPGLEVRTLFDRVHDDVRGHTAPKQSTDAKIPPGFPSPFYFQAPVYVKAFITEADDYVSVQINGDLVMDAAKGLAQKDPKPYALHSGDNFLTVSVFNEKTFRNSQSWNQPEGWKYQVEIHDASASDAPLLPILAGHENTPHKDGSRHGKMFVVAKAVLHVDSERPKVSMLPDVWMLNVPASEDEDHILYQQPLSFLTLTIGGREGLRTQVNQCAAGSQLSALIGTALISLISGQKPEDVISNINNEFTRCVGDSVWAELK